MISNRFGLFLKNDVGVLVESCFDDNDALSDEIFELSRWIMDKYSITQIKF